MVGVQALAAVIPAEAATYSEQAAVGDWPLRLLLLGGLVLVIAVVLLGLRSGWNHRTSEQSDYLLPVRDPGPGLGIPVDGATRSFQVKYIGTTPADDLFTRINPAGGPAAATLRVGAGGVVMELPGPGYLAAAAGDIRSVGTGKGILQKAYKRHGLLLLTWDWNGRPVTTGLWLAQQAEHEAAVGLISELIEPIGGEPTGAGRPRPAGTTATSAGPADDGAGSPAGEGPR